jgi:hypothetical protein
LHGRWRGRASRRDGDLRRWAEKLRQKLMEILRGTIRLEVEAAAAGAAVFRPWFEST